MANKILSAIGCDAIQVLLEKEGCEVITDIPYQEGVLEFLKKEFADVLVLSTEIEGEYSKYRMIEKIREIDSKIKVVIIMAKTDEKFEDFLFERGITDIFIDGESTLEKLINSVLTETARKPQNLDLSIEKQKNGLVLEKNKKTPLMTNLMPRFQKQQIISFVGMGSCGKSTISVQMAVTLAKRTRAKVLLVDFDTINSGLNLFLGESRAPENPSYTLPSDKNGSINYLMDAVDKRALNCDLFEKYIVKSREVDNLFLLTGNKSLYVAKNILNNEYYVRILEKAKELYDFILIDTSSNLFLDATQFSLTNSNQIFFTVEPTYISLERAYRALKEVLPIWGVNNKKVRIIVNKYQKKSLDKSIMEEMLKEWGIAGYISFSEFYDLAANSGKPMALTDDREYVEILEKAELVFKRSLPEKIKNNYFKRLGGAKC